MTGRREISAHEGGPRTHAILGQGRQQERLREEPTPSPNHIILWAPGPRRGGGGLHPASLPPQQDPRHRTPATPSCWRPPGPSSCRPPPVASVDLIQLSPLTAGKPSSKLNYQGSSPRELPETKGWRRVTWGLAVLATQACAPRLPLASSHRPSPGAAGSRCSPARSDLPSAPGLAFRQGHQPHQ